VSRATSNEGMGPKAWLLYAFATTILWGVWGAFTGLSWSDAKNIAAAVAFDITQRDDAQEFIAQRARNVLGGDGMMWDDQQGAYRALNIAATVLGL